LAVRTSFSSMRAWSTVIDSPDWIVVSGRKFWCAPPTFLVMSTVAEPPVHCGEAEAGAAVGDGPAGVPAGGGAAR